MVNNSKFNGTEAIGYCRLVNGSLVIVNSSVANGTEDIVSCKLINGILFITKGGADSGSINCPIVDYDPMERSQIRALKNFITKLPMKL